MNLMGEQITQFLVIGGDEMRKIYCEEVLKEGFDELPVGEVREMVGFYEPVPGTRDWEVTLIEGSYTANTQFEAQVVSSLEEIKAILTRRSE